MGPPIRPQQDPYGDPYATGSSVSQGSQDPFGDPYAQAAGGTQEDPFGDPYAIDVPEAGPPTTRVGIAAAESANRERNMAALRALMESDQTSPAQKARLKRLIEAMRDPMLYNKITEDRLLGSNALRGFLTGFAAEGVLGTADFVASLGQLGAKGVDVLTGTKLAREVEDFRRENIMESQQVIEDTFDPQGVEGSFGRVGGALAGMMIGGRGAGGAKVPVRPGNIFSGGVFGAVASKVAERLAQYPGVIGTAARKGIEGSFLQRLVVNAVSGMPIDLIQAYTLPENDQVRVAREKEERGLQLDAEDEAALDDHYEQQLKVFALGTAAGAVGGAVIEGGIKSLPQVTQKIQQAVSPNPNRQDLTQQADALVHLSQLATQRNTAKRTAGNAWNNGTIEMRKKIMPGLTDEQYAGDFGKLEADIKQSIMETFGGPKIGPQPNTTHSNLNQAQPATPGTPPSAPAAGPTPPTGPATPAPGTPPAGAGAAGAPPSPVPSGPPSAGVAGSVVDEWRETQRLIDELPPDVPGMPADVRAKLQAKMKQLEDQMRAAGIDPETIRRPTLEERIKRYDQLDIEARTKQSRLNKLVEKTHLTPEEELEYEQLLKDIPRLTDEMARIAPTEAETGKEDLDTQYKNLQAEIQRNEQLYDRKQQRGASNEELDELNSEINKMFGELAELQKRMGKDPGDPKSLGEALGREVEPLTSSRQYVLGRRIKQAQDELAAMDINDPRYNTWVKHIQQLKEELSRISPTGPVAEESIEQLLRDTKLLAELEGYLAASRGELASFTPGTPAHRQTTQQIRVWEDMILGYGRVPQGVDINDKILQRLRSVGGELSPAQRTELISHLRNGKTPSFLGIQDANAFKALLEAGGQLHPRVRFEGKGKDLRLVFPSEMLGVGPTPTILRARDMTLERAVEAAKQQGVSPRAYLRRLAGELMSEAQNPIFNPKQRSEIEKEADRILDMSHQASDDLDSTLSRLEKEVEALRQENQQLERRANAAEREALVHDLTGFQNKKAWSKAKDRIDADPESLVISMDIGHLKAINDNLGFDMGDEAIRRLAEAIRGTLDEADRAQVFVIGGDEFFIAGKFTPERAADVLRLIKEKYGVTEIPGVGVNTFVHGGVGSTAKEADEALRTAKAAGIPGAKYDRKTKRAKIDPNAPVRTETGPETKLDDPGSVPQAPHQNAESVLRQEPTEQPPTETWKKTKFGVLQRGDWSIGSSPRSGIYASYKGRKASNFKTQAEAREYVEKSDYAREFEKKVDEEIAKPQKVSGPKEADTRPGRTVKTIDREIRKLEKELDAGKISEAEFSRRVLELGKEKRAIQAAMPKEPTGQPRLKIKMPDTHGKNLKDFTAEQLLATKRMLRALMNGVPKGSPEDDALQAEFKRIMDFEADRDGGQGVNLQMHPSVTGGVGGFFLGFMYEDEDEDRLRNAVIFGAVGLGGGIYAAKRWGPGVKRQRPKLPPWEANVAKKVVSYDDVTKPPRPFFDRLRQGYHTAVGRLVSRSHVPKRVTKALGGENLPVQRNFGKMFEIYGRWQPQTESFLIDGPSMVDANGQVQWLGAMPVQKIFQMVKGDTDRLGLLMASARALELGAKGIRTGIDLMSARMTFIKANPEYHAAMGEMRKYNAALVEVADDAGLVIDRSKMSDIFYAPLNRIFGMISSNKSSATISATSKGGQNINVPNPVKGIKGSQALIHNPAEATVDNTSRVLRSAERNKVAIMLDDLLAAAPDQQLARLIGERLHGGQMKTVPGMAQKVIALQQEMAALGTTVSRAEAEMIVHTFSDEALNLSDDVLRFWRNGKINQLRLNPELAKAFRSLNPEEIHDLMWFLGMPTQAARLGIVNDPTFVGRQAFRDNWQAWLNSEYGFIPVVDQTRGWFHIFTRSKEYQEYLAAGGGYGALAEQRFARGQTALPDVRRAPVRNAADQLAQEIRELRPLSAYQTLITPVVEAARMGEYLRARGAGKTAIEAVYAAKKVTANYQDIGVSMRGIGRLALFLNPSIKSLEQSAKAFNRDPIAYLTKVFVGIALPSYYMWHHYQTDDELNELRKTETGRRYWWARAPGGTIVKIPKPIFDGQVFGSSVETVLDRMELKDPEAMKLTAESIRNDVAVNLLPTIGVVPYSLYANKDLGTGAPIIPMRVEGVDPQYQAAPNTTNFARVVGKEVGAAPTQIDFTIRSIFGTLGSNTVRVISNAVEYQNNDYVAPKEEWPFMDQLFGRYPSMNVGSVREFYSWAEDVDEVAKTIAHATKYDPENVAPYITANPAEASLIKLNQETRLKFAELRHAIETIRSAPSDVMPPDVKRETIDQLLQSIIDLAKNTNYAAREVRAQFQSYEGTAE